jgi:hypothetical protein
MMVTDPVRPSGAPARTENRMDVPYPAVPAELSSTRVSTLTRYVATLLEDSLRCGLWFWHLRCLP